MKFNQYVSYSWPATLAKHCTKSNMSSYLRHGKVDIAFDA